MALEKVASYLTGKNIETPDDETLSNTFNILRPCEGCLPDEEIGEDLLLDIRRKFVCVYYSAAELAADKLKKRGLSYADFVFCTEVDVSYEDTTHVAVVDFNHDGQRPYCYLHSYRKPWNFQFATLKAIAEEVLGARDTIVATFLRLHEKTTRKENA